MIIKSEEKATTGKNTNMIRRQWAVPILRSAGDSSSAAEGIVRCGVSQGSFWHVVYSAFPDALEF